MDEVFGKYILHSTPHLESVVCCVPSCKNGELPGAFVSMIPARPLEAGLSFSVVVSASVSVYHYVEQAALALARCISVLNGQVFKCVTRAVRRIWPPEMFRRAVKPVAVQSLCCFRL
jgi:hypothetical protein